MVSYYFVQYPPLCMKEALINCGRILNKYFQRLLREFPPFPLFPLPLYTKQIEIVYLLYNKIPLGGKGENRGKATKKRRLNLNHR